MYIDSKVQVGRGKGPKPGVLKQRRRRAAGVSNAKRSRLDFHQDSEDGVSEEEGNLNEEHFENEDSQNITFENYTILSENMETSSRYKSIK